MIISRLEMVIGKEIKATSKSVNNLGEKDAGVRFTGRLINLEQANIKNGHFLDSKTSVVIDWDATLKYYNEKVGKGKEWLDYILERKETECEDLKFAIEFSSTDSYTKALEKGRVLKRTNDYIIKVEAQIEYIKGLSIEEVKGEDLPPLDTTGMDERRAIIKEESLGIRINKTDTVDDIDEKIKLARGSK